jgi:hypothetical protein
MAVLAVLAARLAGWKEQVDPAGSPVQVNDTAPGKVPAATTESVTALLWPALSDSFVGFAERVNDAAFPLLVCTTAVEVLDRLFTSPE